MTNFNLETCKNCGHLFNSEDNSKCPKCQMPLENEGGSNLTMSMWSGEMKNDIEDKNEKKDKDQEKLKIYLLPADVSNGENNYVVDKDIFLIGRLKECDLSLPNPKVSRKHAEIRRIKNRFFLVDAGSTNGTFLNNRKLSVGSSYKIKAGDLIRIYKAEFTVCDTLKAT